MLPCVYTIKEKANNFVSTFTIFSNKKWRVLTGMAQSNIKNQGKAAAERRGERERTRQIWKVEMHEGVFPFLLRHSAQTNRRSACPNRVVCSQTECECEATKAVNSAVPFSQLGKVKSKLLLLLHWCPLYLGLTDESLSSRAASSTLI